MCTVFSTSPTILIDHLWFSQAILYTKVFVVNCLFAYFNFLTFSEMSLFSLYFPDLIISTWPCSYLCSSSACYQLSLRLWGTGLRSTADLLGKWVRLINLHLKRLYVCAETVKATFIKPSCLIFASSSIQPHCVQVNLYQEKRFHSRLISLQSLYVHFTESKAAFSIIWRNISSKN